MKYRIIYLPKGETVSVAIDDRVTCSGEATQTDRAEAHLTR